MDGDLTDDPIICACSGMRLSSLVALARENRASFDEMRRITGSGDKCTACLLDLEYYYAIAVTESKGGHTFHATEGYSSARSCTDSQVGTGNKPPMLRRILAVLDRVSPLMPYSLLNSSVLLRGSQLESYILVANDAIGFGEDSRIVPMQYEVAVRDSEGKLRCKDQFDLKPNTASKICLSQYLPEPDAGALSVGSVEVRRKGHRPGYRGTTRPQISIESPVARSVLHTQGYNGPVDAWFSMVYRPDCDRFMLGFVNGTNNPLSFDVYVMPGENKSHGVLCEETIVVPRRGTKLFEVSLPEDMWDFWRNSIFHIRVASGGVGPRSVKFLVSDLNFTRVSMDHPAGK